METCRDIVQIDDIKKSCDINLHFAGENHVKKVRFDVNSWIKKYGNGDFTVSFKSSADGSVKDFPAFIDEENYCVWFIYKSDLDAFGAGTVQILFESDDDIPKVLKSAIFKISIEDGITE